MMVEIVNLPVAFIDQRKEPKIQFILKSVDMGIFGAELENKSYYIAW